MANVPYQPFSTVTPISPGERVQVQTPPEAFGVNVGQAIEHLGTTVDQVGNEMFQRAQALQELKNQTDAQNAGIEHAVEAGKMEAEYKSRPDKERADTLPQYLQQQQDLRNQFRAKLTNPMAQRYFDSDSVPFTRRIIFAASALAGEAQKKYTVDTLKAGVDVKLHTMEDYPDDEAGNARRINDIKQDVTTLTQMEHGVDDPNHPIVKDAVLHATSKAILSQAMGWNKTDPEKAMGFIEQHKNDMTIEDYNRAKDMFEFKSNSIISANITREVLAKHLQPDKTYDVSQTDLVNEARQLAEQRHPENKFLQTAVDRAIKSEVNTDRWGAQKDFIDARTAFYDLMGKYKPKDTQEFLAIPGADMLAQRLPPTMRNQLDATIFDWRRKANVVTRDETKRYLDGLKNNNVEQFLNIPDFNKFDGLSASDVDQYQKAQQALIKNPRDDPRLNRAMGFLRTYFPDQLQAMHVYHRDPNPGQRQKDYDSLTGLLQEELQIHLQDTGKPATPTEIQEVIGPRVLQHHAVRGFFHPIGEEVPVFRGFTLPKPEDVPPDFKDTITKDVLSKGGTMPTDHQVYQAYLRKLYVDTLKKFKGNGGTEPGR